MDDDHKSGDPKDLLSRPERDRLVAEERLRATVREDLEKSRNPPRGRFARLVSSGNIRWIATTLAIPLTVFAWGEYSRRAQAAEHEPSALEADKERKSREAVDIAHHNIDLVIRLLTDLTKTPGLSAS